MIFTIPNFRIASPGNGSQGRLWEKVKDRKRQRTIIKWSLHSFRPPPLPVVVTLTRIGVRDLDDDNLAAGFKSVRDEVAAWLGCGDGKKDPVTWVYEQERGPPKVYAVTITVESPAMYWERKNPVPF